MPYGNLGWNLDKFKVRSAAAQTIWVDVLYDDGSDSVNTSYALPAETSASFATIAGVAATGLVRSFFLRAESGPFKVAERDVATTVGGILIPFSGVPTEFRSS